MIFHGLLGNVQVRGDFFVGEAFRDERNELLLASGQAEFEFDLGARKVTPLFGARSEQREAEFGRAHRLACGNGLYRCDNCSGGGVF